MPSRLSHSIPQGRVDGSAVLCVTSRLLQDSWCACQMTACLGVAGWVSQAASHTNPCQMSGAISRLLGDPVRQQKSSASPPM